MKNCETDTIEVAVNVRLWRVNGCHELLASLGFDLAEVGQDEVTLRTGKAANRRHIQFVLQALLALFGKWHYTLTYLPSHHMRFGMLVRKISLI